MRRRQTVHVLFLLALGVSTVMGEAAHAQKHSGRSSPATAPPPPPVVQPAPLVPVSSGMGAIQFVQVNYGVPAPQALTRQLRFEDDRTRAAALSAIGSPGQYLQHGHIPMPRSVSLELVPLSTSDELDALLTVELEGHLVTAVLIPVDGNWRRVATLIFATPYNDPSTTPTTWVGTARSLSQPDRYRAIFHASTGSMKNNFVENEAHLRVINGHAVIVMSFESTARECTAAATPGNKQVGKPGCNVTHRWFRADPTDAAHRFELITGSGRMSDKEAAEPLADSRTVLISHLRNFSCQPFVYNESAARFEVSGPNGPCHAAPK